MKYPAQFYNSRFYYVAIGSYIVLSFTCAILTTDMLPRWRFLTNDGGSMLPLIHSNDVALVQSERDDLYNAGDVVAFVSLLGGQETIVTHRIISRGGNAYRTQGDANTVADQEVVVPRRIIGRVIWVIPALGAFLKVLKSPIGSIIFFLVPAVYFIATECIRIVHMLRSR